FSQAQAAKPKKGGKPAASASAAPETAPAPTPEPTPEPAPKPAPADGADAKPEKKELPDTPPEKGWDTSDTAELPGKTYYFIGARYRLDAIPKFMVNLFVDEGATFVSHIAGFELDIRKDAHTTMPWIAFQTFGFGDTLFHEKGKDDTPQNWTIVD